MRIAVHGDGIVAHLAALMLVRAGQSVTRVPSGTGNHGLGPIGGAVLGLPEWEASEIAGAIGWVPGSAFTLGIGFGGWGADNWFWPFGDTGAVLDGVPFAQVAARVRAGGRRVALGDFALSAIAAALDGAGVTTIYPGLPAHPQHDLAMRQMGSGGTMIGIDLGTQEAAFAALNRMRVVSISNNLGDAKSIATHPATTTHQRLSQGDRATLGIGPGMIRLSIGLEHPDDLIADLRRGLG